MQNPMQCKQCSSHDFKKISDSVFRCNYCGTNYYNDGTLVPGGVPSAAGTMNRNRNALIMGAVVALTVTFGATVFIFMGSSSRPTSPAVSGGQKQGQPDKPIEFGPEAVQNKPKPTGSFTRIAEIPDSIGNVYFMGIYKNTGESVMQKPMVTMVLYSADGRKVAAGNGYAIRETLQPGEETPVIVLVNKPPKYARYEAKSEPEAPYGVPRERPKMAFRNVVMKQGVYSGYVITGEIVNKDRKDARWVNTMALLIDRDNRIIGGGTGYLAEKSLKAGDYSPFHIDVTTVKGTPRSFRIDYNCSPVE